jgi:CO/xanthine dehydrogenase Mo-binding subunit
MIGKPVPRIDGRAKVTGKAIYSDDLILPRTMYAKVLHAKYAHAKILRIDTEKAKALPGVVAVYTAKDIKFNDKYFRMGNTHDTWVLAEDYVRYIGDMLAFVVAEEEEIAEEALDLIEVDYEELPVVSHLKDAYQAENLARSDKPGNVGMPLVVERGEVEKDFAEATVFASGKYTYPSLHQLHLEPNSATAVYELGKLTVYCASQVWFHIREDISAVTVIPEKDIEIKPMCIGGAFGARNDQPLPVFTALLATMVKGTVKMTNSRLEEFLACRPSVGMEIEITLAADSEGNFLSKKIKLLSGFGAYSSDSDAVTAIACFRADNNYRFRSAYAEATGLYLNHALRSFPDAKGRLSPQTQAYRPGSRHNGSMQPHRFPYPLPCVSSFHPNSSALSLWPYTL